MDQRSAHKVCGAPIAAWESNDLTAKDMSAKKQERDGDLATVAASNAQSAQAPASRPDGAHGDALPEAATRAVLENLKSARADALRRLDQPRASGLQVARELSSAYDAAISNLFELALMETGADPYALSVAAVGGYGRGALAPYSDIDLLFLVKPKIGDRERRVIELILHSLWDIGARVGQSLRTVDEAVRLAKSDLSIATSLLDVRHLSGAPQLIDELRNKHVANASRSEQRGFISAHLEERARRHEKAGKSRFLVEPDVKDGKGGLRDLHSLFWMSKYAFGAKTPEELQKLGILEPAEARGFLKAFDFLWTVRMHLHAATARPEDRLTFELQPNIAERLGYKDRPGASAVQRFMRHYFIVAKQVGALTRLVSAALEERRQKERPSLFSFFKKLTIEEPDIEHPSFRSVSGRIDFVEKGDPLLGDPVNMIRLFHIADRTTSYIHPAALRRVRRNRRLIDSDLRADEEANRLFLECVTDGRDPERVLRVMNEAGVLGRFVPEFGRLIGRVTYGMYHRHTLDEHTIQAMGVLEQIARGRLGEDHPIATRVIGKIQDLRPLRLAVFLHDIGYGFAGGEGDVHECAKRLGLRFGLEPEAAEELGWAVANYPAMAEMAERRDVHDPKTITDFAAIVGTRHRLRLLLVISVCNMRVIGPDSWDGFKRRLLTDLYEATRAELRGESLPAPRERFDEAVSGLDGPQVGAAAFERFGESFWETFDPEEAGRYVDVVRRADADNRSWAAEAFIDDEGDATAVFVYGKDRPGLIADLSKAFAIAGGTILDARVNTMSGGEAADVFRVQHASGGPLEGEALNRALELAGSAARGEAVEGRAVDTISLRRAQTFEVPPVVEFDNAASDSCTVIDAFGLDRPGLLRDLAGAIAELGLHVQSAHIATRGERAADVFYVQCSEGAKIEAPETLQRIQARLIEALTPAA